MKLKEAMLILAEFQKVAGEDAEIHLEEFRLCGAVKPMAGLYSYQPKVCYSIVALPYEVANMTRSE